MMANQIICLFRTPACVNLLQSLAKAHGTELVKSSENLKSSATSDIWS